MMRQRSLAIIRIRAIIGALFAAAGVVIGVRVALDPHPFNTKLIGFAFTVVLIGLGGVRVREYYLAQKAGVT